MNISQIKRILNKYLSGNASDKEKYLIDQYLREAWDNKEVPEDSEVHRMVVLDSIRKAIRPRYYLNWFSVAAASVLLLITAGAGYRYYYEIDEWLHPMPLTKATAEKFRIKRVMLPDSSIAILNEGTTIEYPATFRGRERIVKVNGEAFFDVVPDKHPFVIAGPNLRVIVLGTSFIVSDSSAALLPKVSVKTGKVAVAVASLVQQISASEELVYDSRNNQVNILRQQDVNVAWTTKSLVFNENTLGEVFSMLENMYHTKIRCNNIDISNQKFTGAFEANDGLDTILKVLTVSYRLHILKNNDGIVIK